MKKAASLILLLICTGGNILSLSLGTQAQAVPYLELESTKSPTSIINVPERDAVDWINTDNALVSNDQYASATSRPLYGDPSAYLWTTGYNFDVPADGEILGITAQIEKYRESSTSIRDKDIRVIIDGSSGSENKATGGTWDSFDDDSYDTYGGSDDLWNEEWTYSDINASNFGVLIAGDCDGEGDWEKYYRVDHVQITVHYQVPDLSYISNLGAALDAVLFDDFVTNVETGGTGQFGSQHIVIEKAGSCIGIVWVDFSNDRDWSSVIADTDLKNGKAIISNLGSAPGAADTHELLIPKQPGDDSVGICPEAESLLDVSQDCPGFEIKDSTDSDVSTFFNNGTEYWRVSGLSSTGGISFIYDDLFPPEEVNGNQEELVLEETGFSLILYLALTLVLVSLHFYKISGIKKGSR